MRAIRDVIDVSSDRISYKLPSGFSATKVELIVLSIDEQQSGLDNTEREAPVSLRGALKAFSNPSLIDDESKAWKQAAKVKYEKN